MKYNYIYANIHFLNLKYMLLLKTLILPTDDSELACTLLREYLNNSKYVLFVVMGDDSKARDTVALADRKAGKIEEPQWVVWVRNPKMAKPALEEMKLSDANLLKDWNKTLAVCANPKATICFVLENHKVPGSLDILEAFTTCKTTANIGKVGTIPVPALTEERSLDLSSRQVVPPADTKDKPSTDKKDKPSTDKKKTDKPK